MCVLGVIHSGMGCAMFNKLLSCLNLPRFNEALFKRYEREVGPVLEKVAKESCKRAAEEERQLVIEKIEDLCKKL